MARAVLIFRNAAVENARLELEARQIAPIASAIANMQNGATRRDPSGARGRRQLDRRGAGAARRHGSRLSHHRRHPGCVSRAEDRLQRGDGPARTGDARGDGRHRRHPLRRPGYRQGGGRLVGAHRGSGFQPRGDHDRGRADREHGQDRRRRLGARAGCGRRRRRRREKQRARCRRGGRGDGRDRPVRRARSARSSASSTTSRFKPICWRSTPASRRRGRATPGAVSPSSPPRCADCRSARRKRPRRSRR